MTCAYMPTICLCVMRVCVRLALTMCEFQDFPDVRVDLCSNLCASIFILTIRNLDYYFLFDLENALNPQHITEINSKIYKCRYNALFAI